MANTSTPEEGHILDKTADALTRIRAICDRNLAEVRKQKEDAKLADLRRRGVLWCPHKNE